jgi:hypothetical protein
MSPKDLAFSEFLRHVLSFVEPEALLPYSQDTATWSLSLIFSIQSKFTTV